MSKRIIYYFCNSCSHEWHVGLAMDDAGECVAEHVCSSHFWLLHDLILRPDRKEGYDKAYPDGWEAEYVERPKEHAGLMAAYAKNQARRKEVAP